MQYNYPSQFSVFIRPAPKNEEEIMVAIFEAIDRLFCIVRPRRLLYMAIDGVVSLLVSTAVVSKLTHFKLCFRLPEQR